LAPQIEVQDKLIEWPIYFSSFSASQRFGELVFSLTSKHWLKLVDDGSVISNLFVKGSYTDLISRDIATGLNSTETFFESEIFLQLLTLAGDTTKDLWKDLILPALTLALCPTKDPTDQVAVKTAGDDQNSASYLKFTESLTNKQLACGKTAALEKVVKDAGVHVGNLPALAAILCTNTSDRVSLLKERNSFITSPVFKSTPIKTRTESNVIYKDSGSAGTFGFNNKAEIIPGEFKLSKYEASSLERFFISGNFLEQLSAIIGKELGSSTALNKLQTIASVCGIDLIVNARSATAAPTLPVFKADSVWRTISAKEILNIKSNTQFYESLAGVMLIGTLPTLEAVNALDNQGDETVTAINQNQYGAFIGKESGRMLILKAPEFLRHMGAADSMYGDTAAQSTFYAKTTKRPLQQTTLKSYLQMGCDYSRIQWLHENYKNRTLTFNSQLRFDIAPGSRLRLKGIDLSPLGVKEDTPLYGFVRQVGITIDCSSGMAYSSFMLSHIRPELTDKEEKDLIPDSHPMFDGADWRGCPLVRINDNDMKPTI
jgi:hypothetical protein